MTIWGWILNTIKSKDSKEPSTPSSEKMDSYPDTGDLMISIPISIREKLLERFPGPEGAAYLNKQTTCYFQRLLNGEEIIAILDLPNVIHRSIGVDHTVFEQIVSDFRGLHITGEKLEESMYVPSPKLYELLTRYKTIAILKNERAPGMQEVEFTKESGIRDGMKLTTH
jgi:hypothetical protein